MPITKQGYKRMRADKKRHVRNLNTKSGLKTLTKKFHEYLSSKELEKARGELRILTKKLAKAASKGVVHKKTASRKISRLTKALSALSKVEGSRVKPA